MAARANDTPPAYDPAQVRLAGFGRRFAALLIDWAICLVVAAFYANPQAVPWPPVLVLIVLNTVLIGLFGQTPGMALAGLRCIAIRDGGAIGLGRAFVRAILLALLIPAVVTDASRRGWHDRAAGSVVVLR
ncbi:RDD family protein [Jidongwangia harbinensis]|uniref:RDD family protein n=1 Tax=Jidongwangia harbinensis TaxID=2878561 RepID=UPI001CDA3839|nr:RDD family protein [Jidongwangia harbinensis]MCA2212529.1 RDD family protein [Jidongwangia harbinensis]